MVNLSCGEFRSRWDQRLDGVLADVDVALFERHRADCRHCAAEWASYSRTVSWVRALPRAAAPRGFAAGVMTRLDEHADTRPRRRFVFPFAGRLAAGVLAAITIGFVFSQVSPLRDALMGIDAPPPAAAVGGESPSKKSESIALDDDRGFQLGSGERERKKEGVLRSIEPREKFVGSANPVLPPSPKDAAVNPDLLKTVRQDEKHERAEREVGESLAQAEEARAGAIAGGESSAPTATSRDFGAPTAPPPDPALPDPQLDTAESGAVAYLSRDETGRDVVLVPKPEEIDRVFLLDASTGSMTDLRMRDLEVGLANNFRPEPLAEVNSLAEGKGGGLTPAIRLPSWNGAHPESWQEIPISTESVEFGAARRDADAPPADGESSNREEYRLYVLDVAPDQVSASLGVLLNDLRDAGDWGGTAMSEPGSSEKRESGGDGFAEMKSKAPGTRGAGRASGPSRGRAVESDGPRGTTAGRGASTPGEAKTDSPRGSEPIPGDARRSGAETAKQGDEGGKKATDSSRSGAETPGSPATEASDRDRDRLTGLGYVSGRPAVGDRVRIVLVVPAPPPPPPNSPGTPPK